MRRAKNYVLHVARLSRLFINDVMKALQEGGNVNKREQSKTRKRGASTGDVTMTKGNAGTLDLVYGDNNNSNNNAGTLATITTSIRVFRSESTLFSILVESATRRPPFYTRDLPTSCSGTTVARGIHVNHGGSCRRRQEEKWDSHRCCHLQETKADAKDQVGT